MGLFDGNLSDTDQPETDAAMQEAFERDADVRLCAHATGIKLGTSPDGETILIVRIVGHTQDQEDDPDKANKTAMDFALSIDDAMVFGDNLSTAVMRAMERQDPLVAMLTKLLLGADPKSN